MIIMHYLYLLFAPAMGITFISHYIPLYPLISSLPFDHIKHLLALFQLRQVDVQDLKAPICVRFADTRNVRRNDHIRRIPKLVVCR